MHNHPSNVQSSYDKVASKYALHFFNEQEGKPMDRIQLQRFTDRLNGRGPVCDLGWRAWTNRTLFAAMRRKQRVWDRSFAPNGRPGQREQRGDPFPSGQYAGAHRPRLLLAGAAAFYSIVHFSLEEVRQAFKEVYRVLQPGGWLLIAFHIGEEVVHIDRWWNKMSTSTSFSLIRTKLRVSCKK
jgi:SAM-dependent methyltransferase